MAQSFQAHLLSAPLHGVFWSLWITSCSLGTLAFHRTLPRGCTHHCLYPRRMIFGIPSSHTPSVPGNSLLMLRIHLKCHSHSAWANDSLFHTPSKQQWNLSPVVLIGECDSSPIEHKFHGSFTYIHYSSALGALL